MKYDISLVFPTSPFLLNQQVFPPLGVMYLSSWLKESGFKTQVLDLAWGDHREQAEAKVIGISLTTPQRQEAYELVKYYKGKGKTVIAGGPHATHMPEECLKAGFDYVVRGEGEIALDALLLALEGRIKIENRIISGGEMSEIDRTPYPDRESVPILQYDYKIEGRQATTLMTTRGCPYDCSFCARAVKTCRMQSAERTCNEIVHVADKYGFEAFMIFDDVFVANKKRVKAIADTMNGYGFLFRCFVRSNLVNQDTCKLLRQMGVVEAGIGVESGSDEILKRNLKGTTRGMNIDAVRMLHDNGIRAKAFLIVGLPGESVATISETISWIEEAKPYDVDVSVFQPLPGSPIFNDPDKWDIKFEYNGAPGWYKGTPGEYESTVRTGSLQPRQIVEWRDYIERKHKRKELLR
jgi:radical SAM superfamily enzyme YgiQ (UPF0313 family)